MVTNFGHIFSLIRMSAYWHPILNQSCVSSYHRGEIIWHLIKWSYKKHIPMQSLQRICDPSYIYGTWHLFSNLSQCDRLETNQWLDDCETIRPNDVICFSHYNLVCRVFFFFYIVLFDHTITEISKENISHYFIGKHLAIIDCTASTTIGWNL